MIDIDPGYQKLCGTDALAYVRYRHGDNDLVRAARQQDFLRQVRSAKGSEGADARAGSAREPEEARADLRRYFDSRQGPATTRRRCSSSRRPCCSPRGNPVREVRFRVDRRARQGQPRRVRGDAREDGVGVPRREGVGEAARADRADRRPTSGRRSSAPSSRKNKPSSIKGLEEARAEGENQAILASRKIDFPFYFPTLRTSNAAYQGQEPRTYTIRDERRKKHDAYRLVLAKGIVGEYYGVQGTTWRYPPILDDPHETIVRDGRKLMVYRDGKRVRLVAWRTRKAVYWVSNTLTQSLGSQQMIGIASSLKRLGG